MAEKSPLRRRESPDIITSCCGSLFSSSSSGLASDISSLPVIPMKVAFYLSVFLTVASGVGFYWKARGGYLFSSMSVVTFVVSILMPFRNTESLAKVVPSVQRRLALTSVVLFLIFTIIVTIRMVFSDFMLGG